MTIFDLRKERKSSFMEQRTTSRTLGKFPNTLDFVVMAIWVFLAQVAVVGICGLCGLEFPDTALANSPDDQVSLFAQLATAQSLAIVYPISMLLAIAGVLLCRRLRGGERKRMAFSKGGFNPSRLLGLFVLMVATQIAIEPLTALMPDPAPMVGRGFFTVLVSVVFAPIFEEILCRGIVLESFRAKYGVWAAWLCSSLFFGIIHGQITAMFSASVLGLILGYAYIRTNSIFSVVILHALNNGLALALMAFGLGDSTFREAIPEPKIYWMVWGVALLIVIIGAVSMVRNIPKMVQK